MPRRFAEEYLGCLECLKSLQKITLWEFGRAEELGEAGGTILEIVSTGRCDIP